MNEMNTVQSEKRAIWYACLLGCLVLAAMLPIIAVRLPSVSANLFVKLWGEGYFDGTYKVDLSAYLVLAVVSALSLALACFSVIRAVSRGKQLSSTLVVPCWVAFVCDCVLWFLMLVMDEQIVFGPVSRPLLLFAMGLNVCATLLLRALCGSEDE